MDTEEGTVEFMLLFIDRKGAPAGAPGEIAEMKQFAGELARQGKFLRGAPLSAESAAVRVRVQGGRTFVNDGPFAESREVVGGFWIIEVASRAEAIAIAGRCPHARHGVVEVRLVRWRDAAAEPREGVPFLFMFRMEPDLTDCDGAKLREMVAFGEELKREGRFLETAPLAHDPPAARIEARGGKLLVTDGPFAESKEGVGGYSLVCAASRAEAVEIATRYPHARWGPVEVREMDFGPP
jgi:hypothetical protein